jgi:hypothetical protein
MERIGRGGELLRQDGYHDWPLFREFRGSPQFLATYQKIYGQSFTENLTRKATEAGAEALKAALQQETVEADGIAQVEGRKTESDQS